MSAPGQERGDTARHLAARCVAREVAVLDDALADHVWASVVADRRHRLFERAEAAEAAGDWAAEIAATFAWVLTLDPADVGLILPAYWPAGGQGETLRDVLEHAAYREGRRVLAYLDPLFNHAHLFVVRGCRVWRHA